MSDSGTPPPRLVRDGLPSNTVKPVKKAYEQIADQLRDLIIDGSIRPGDRLPTEAELALEFGSSRATVREALRVLSSLNLIRTTKGASGGSFVSEPSADHIADFLSANISLLSQAEHITLDDLLEARSLLEIPAARMAAQRRDAKHLELLRGTIPNEPLGLETERQFVLNRHFHSALVEASGNSLLSIAAQPVFYVLQTHLRRSNLGDDYHLQINQEHHVILKAIEEGDDEGVERAMRTHMDYLRPRYETAWSALSAGEVQEGKPGGGEGPGGKSFAIGGHG